MHRSGAVALFMASAFSLIGSVSGQLITITELATACSAVYTTGYQSVTVVQSTVTVKPIQWSDSAANSGTPFVIGIQDASFPSKRQAQIQSWLMANGNTTTDGTQATRYQIKDGQLSNTDGVEYLTTSMNIVSEPIALASSLGSIRTTFNVQGSILNWTYPGFSDGLAQFFRTPKSTVNNAEVIALFNGPIDPDWSPVLLFAAPITSVPQHASSASQSTSIATGGHIGTASMSPWQNEGFTPSGSSSWTTPPPPSSSASSNISPSAQCGAETGNTCSGSAFGECCSQFGYCGSGGRYCGSGCLPAYGSCSMSSLSASKLDSVTSIFATVNGVSNGGLTSSSFLSSSGQSTGLTTPGSTVSPNGYQTTSYSTSFAMGLSMPSTANTIMSSSPSQSSSSATSGPVSTEAVSPNGHCGTIGNGGTPDGYTCSGSMFGECCSSSGFCGNSTDYCLAGCQSAFGSCTPQRGNPITSQGECGMDWGNQTCTDGAFGPCCSTSGYCGSTDDYCGTGNCDPMFGVCSGTSSTTTMVPLVASSSSTTIISSNMGSTASGQPFISPLLSTSSVLSSRVTSLSSSTSPISSLQSTSLSTSSGNLPGSSMVMGPSGYDGMLSSASLASSAVSASSAIFFSSDAASRTSGTTTISTITTSATSSTSLTSTSDADSDVGLSGSSTSTSSSASAIVNSVSATSSGYSSSSSPSSSSIMPSSGISSLSSFTMLSSSSISSVSSSKSLSSAPSSSPIAMSSSSSSSSSSPVVTSSSSTSPSSMSTTITNNMVYTSSSSITMASASSSRSVSSSRTSMAPTATPSYACPGSDGQTVNDGFGNQFVVGCKDDTSMIAYTSGQAYKSWDDCFAVCQNSPSLCTAFTYYAPYSANGIGPGTCFLKNGMSENFTPGSGIYVGAIKLQYYNATGNTNFTTSSTSSPSSTQTSSTMTTSNPAITTTTSSSSIMWSSTSSATRSTQYLVLASPTPCDFGDLPSSDEDDSYCEIDLPFSMTMYAQSGTSSYASTNGFISILNGSSQYQAMTFPDPNIPNNTVAPLFEDLYKFGSADPPQGIFYQFNPANTGITYEYYESRGDAPNSTYHFTVAYDSTQPGIFTYTYYSVGGSADDGLAASVGTQGINSAGNAQGYTYSFKSNDITPGLAVTCNTLLNTCTTGS